jgi:hypothetical protein
MRTRCVLAAAILVLASIPGALCVAEEAGCNPAPAVAATASQPAPAATVLPVQVSLPNQTLAPQTPQAIDNKPTFLITTCSECITSTGCRRLHSCVLMGCC